MSSDITLNNFLTTLTCLTSFNSQSPAILHNNHEFKLSNTPGCPPQTLKFVGSQVRQLTAMDEDLLENLQKSEESIDSFHKRISKLESRTVTTISSCVGQPSGYVALTVPDLGNTIVYCDHNILILGPNWLLIAQRNTGDLDFNVPWLEYKYGFGELSREFFIGLDRLHALTVNERQELLVYMEKHTGEIAYAHYDYFSIGHETDKYALRILGAYKGTAGDALRYHAGQKFSTYDMDNDAHGQHNCAKLHMGAWWYSMCEQSNLFGQYQKPGEPEPTNHKGILWKGFLDGPNGSLKTVKMFIRPHLI